MPTFGKSNARAPKKAAASSARKPRMSSADKFASKAREDGRGGRAPHRIERAEAPRGKRASFFEEGSRKTYGNTDSGAGRSESRPSYGNRDDRAPRGDRSESRGSWGNRDNAGRGERSYGQRSDRPSYGRDNGRDGENKGSYGRDWSPKSDDSRFSRSRAAGERGDAGTGRPAKRTWGNPADRDSRPSYGRDDWQGRNSGPARSGEARERNGFRDDRGGRPAWGNRDDRAPRREWSDEKPARAGREDRPSYGRDDRTRFEDRQAKRSWGGDSNDRGYSRDDRESRNPNRPDRAERDASRETTFRGARDANPNKKAFFEDKVLERLEVEMSEVVTEDTFEAMGLHPKVLAALTGMGAEKPFPIQASTIPTAIAGRDVLGRGKTGSGKTIAFTVPLVTKLIAAGSVPRKPGKPRALILAPTRELADQIDRTVNGIARPVGFYTACIYGGVPQRKQENAMSRGVDIVVATPGRLEDLMAQKIIDLSEVETMVIDEADHMCDLGFIEGVRRIMRAAGDTQKLLFSATLDREVDALVKEFLPDPYVYEVPNEEQDTSNITHRVFTVEQDDRSAVLLRLVQGEGKSLIFTRTKMTAERLSESLTQAGVPAARIHGDLNQNQRNRNLERFTKGAVRVLVATDVAARGIHVDDVALVIQVDPPEEYKTYLHRSGRTGRGHNTGTVITLIPRSRRRRMEDLLRRAERDGIFSDVRPSNPLLEELAGPIAPPPAPEILDFGDSRGGGSGGGRGRGEREGRGGSGGRGREGRGNYGGNGKGRWADKGAGDKRPRARKFD